jgi:energy-coupling factor transport system ATP-binding protein
MDRMKIELIGIKFQFEESEVLKGVELTIDNGTNIILSGNTGAGKTTLLRVIDLLLRPTGGKILLNGCEAYDNTYEYRKKIGFLFQFPEDQFFSETVFDEISYAARNFKVPDIDESVNRAISYVNLDPSFLKMSPFRLSGGEKRKVAIASILVHSPQLLLLDEPTAGLDIDGMENLVAVLKKWKSNGGSYIVATHSPEYFEPFTDREVILRDGRLFESPV